MLLYQHYYLNWDKLIYHIYIAILTTHLFVHMLCTQCFTDNVAYKAYKQGGDW